ncbi:MAG: MFS transporter [Sphaerochaetaceae bacterium]
MADSKSTIAPPDKKLRHSAFAFIVLMGFVSMASDMTHEGASSIMGAFLSMAGASAAAIGFVSGLGEFIGYSLRIVSGIFTDKTRKYWPMTIIGYVFDCIAIPALALVPEGGWVLACFLIVLQRTGKAIKKPAKDTLLSFAVSQTGAGTGFAIQEMLDQIGAFLGPVMLFIVTLVRNGDDLFSTYQLCFLILGIPAVVTVLLLLIAKKKYPNPEKFEPPAKEIQPEFKMNHSFMFFIAATCLFAAGYLDFPIITMHAQKMALIPDETLSLLYAGAMLIDAFSALLFGKLFDRFGTRILAVSTLAAAPFAIFIFGFDARWALFLGVGLWGLGMGAQESILKAAVTSIVPKKNRSSGFGIFQTAFGAFWFAGSALMGILYDKSIAALIVFSTAMQLASIPLFLLSSRKSVKAEA